MLMLILFSCLQHTKYTILLYYFRKSWVAFMKCTFYLEVYYLGEYLFVYNRECLFTHFTVWMTSKLGSIFILVFLLPTYIPGVNFSFFPNTYFECLRHRKKTRVGVNSTVEVWEIYFLDSQKNAKKRKWSQ